MRPPALLALLFFLLPGFCTGQQKEQLNNIVPKPVSYTLTSKKKVQLSKASVLWYDSRFKEQAQYAQQAIQQQTGLQLAMQPIGAAPAGSPSLQLLLDSAIVTRPEMYTLSSHQDQVILRARDVAGMVHGLQTLLQLLPLHQKKKPSLPSVEVRDYPQFAYRGMHLDVSRHFFPVSFVKKYLDYLAFHKFNTFHWHLTDDQGWRLEIKSYPRLNEIGSYRNATLIGHFKATPARYDSTRYGGFYTQEEVREVVRYAAVRGITVIPEIDIPGHSRAIIAAYPELSTRPDTTWQVATTWGMYNRQNNVLAPTPATFQFLETVFAEVASLFPAPYIHIGGDETSKIWWKASPSTQAFMQAHQLKDEEALQTYFIKQVAGYLAKSNKKIIGWHEILEGDLDTTAIVMNWAGAKEGLMAAQRHHPVIMTPGKPLYFDAYQSKDPNDSLAIHGYNPLDAVYHYHPVPQEVEAAGLSRYILGAQGNVWTEYMGSPAKVEYMVFPRMTALSEVLWTPASAKDYQDFKRRLKTTVLPRYKFWQSAYFPHYEQWTADK